MSLIYYRMPTLGMGWGFSSAPARPFSATRSAVVGTTY